MPIDIIEPPDQIASTASKPPWTPPRPKTVLEDAATAFLKRWVTYVEAVPAEKSEEYMKGMCNAIWQIREIFLKP